ncbi:MAG: saccharopine dehydrogenase family protein [Planctomycetaceae bacterium]|jgi:saccharopine dehydrogenase (NAD+, L-lysine-forming)|nr:saccharopine dehydrogenase family protein [Planctomycetaceae bacterium]
MDKVLIIGAGGVGRVAAFKCAQHPEVFREITLASRTRSKCDAIVADIKTKMSGRADKASPRIAAAQVDADRAAELAALINDVKPDLVMNIALPYQDLTIMDACLETGVHYLDTANYEHPDTAHFCYSPQWKYHERFAEAGLTALLGSGFDPGITNVYTAYARKHYFERMDTVDIIDCNAGDHGYPFATNFNPEINIREVSAKGRYYENGTWHETEPLSVKKIFDFPDGIGPKEMYLLYHEEMESLVRYYPEVQRMRFWMTFGQSYLTHLKVLQNVGMTRIDPVMYNGQEIIPLQFLKMLLPDPASLGAKTKGKTCIGCWITGSRKDGDSNPSPFDYYIYNTCVHEECFAETGAQAVSYTTGVPAALGAAMVMTGQWSGRGVFNMEQFDPDPFMQAVGDWGLPWQEIFNPHFQI